MIYDGNRWITLSTGKRFEAPDGFDGLFPGVERDGREYLVWTGEALGIDEDGADGELTPAERAEVAEEMARLWRLWSTWKPGDRWSQPGQVPAPTPRDR